MRYLSPISRNHLSSAVYRPITALLAVLACLLGMTWQALAQPVDTQFGDNFDGYTTGSPADGFKKGGTSNATWSVNAPGSNGQFRNVITNPPGIGGGVSYSVRGMPYMGGLHRKDFTISSTFRVVSATATGYSIGLVALGNAHPYNTTNGPYYYFAVDGNGTIKINSNLNGTTGLTLGTPTHLSGGVVVGTTYTFTVEGTYTGDSLALDFTVTGGANTASLSATAATALTGPSFGFQNRAGNAGSAITVDVDNYTVSVPMSFTQVWADEFTGTTLDTSVWSTGYRWADVINNELQAMRPENVVIGNGLCTIHTTNPANPVQNQTMTGYQWGSFDYASGAIQTYDKWTKTYGYFEARMKMPSGKGTWPAFWLLPDRGPTVTPLTNRVSVGDNGYGRGSEIDITEYMAAWTDPVTQLSNSHSGLIWSYASGGGTATGDYALLGDGFGPDLWYDAEGSFHTYGVYWEPGVVTFYIDGKVVLTRQQATYVPNVPHYMILNTSITQNDWHGNTIPISEINAGMPSQLEIDYVRVYDVTPGGSGGGGSGSREPEADAYVRDGSYQNTNYGTATTLTVKNDVASYNRETYLKFDASGLGSASSVQLQLNPTFVGSQSPTLRFDFVTSDTWTETGITWTNKPASSGVVLGTLTGPFTVGQPITVDVTTQAQAAANGDGILSIRVLSTVSGSNRNIDFGSRENSTTGNRPVLVY